MSHKMLCLALNTTLLFAFLYYWMPLSSVYYLEVNPPEIALGTQNDLGWKEARVLGNLHC